MASTSRTSSAEETEWALPKTSGNSPTRGSVLILVFVVKGSSLYEANSICYAQRDMQSCLVVPSTLPWPSVAKYSTTREWWSRRGLPPRLVEGNDSKVVVISAKLLSCPDSDVAPPVLWRVKG